MHVPSRWLMVFTTSVLVTLCVSGCHINVGTGSAHMSSQNQTITGKGLTEFDITGAGQEGFISDKDISDALSSAKNLKLRPQSRVLTIESGHAVPDSAFLDVLRAHVQAIPMSGLATEKKNTESAGTNSFARALRLAAARQGADTILCFWPVIEIGHIELPTSTVSWLPVLDLVVPDERGKVRISCKFVIVNVEQGTWSVVNAPPHEEEILSTAYQREHKDPSTVNEVKRRAYRDAVDFLIAEPYRPGR